MSPKPEIQGSVGLFQLHRVQTESSRTAQGLGIEVKEMLHLIDAFGGPYENLIQDFELALNKHNINNLENRAFAKALSSEVQDFRNVKTGRHRGRVQLSEVAALVTDPQQKDRQHYYKKYFNRSPSHGTVPETMGSASTWEHPQIEQGTSHFIFCVDKR